MRKFIALAAAVVLIQAASMARAADISFNINVGGPPIVIAQPPDFLYPPELGFGVAVGVPCDMFYFSGIYYVNRGGGWYRCSSYGGSWTRLRHRELPTELRRYKIANIRQFRDREYRVYAQDRNHYRGKYFRPGGSGPADRRDLKKGSSGERQDRREQSREEHRGERREEGRER